MAKYQSTWALQSCIFVARHCAYAFGVNRPLESCREGIIVIIDQCLVTQA